MLLRKRPAFLKKSVPNCLFHGEFKTMGMVEPFRKFMWHNIPDTWAIPT